MYGNAERGLRGYGCLQCRDGDDSNGVMVVVMISCGDVGDGDDVEGNDVISGSDSLLSFRRIQHCG